MGSRCIWRNEGLIGEMGIWELLRREDRNGSAFQEERKEMSHLPPQLPCDKIVTPSLMELTIGLE